MNQRIYHLERILHQESHLMSESNVKKAKKELNKLRRQTNG